MTMDSFTVKSLPDHSGIVDSLNEVSYLYRDFNQGEGGPSQDAIDFFNANKHKMVRVTGARKIGVVVKLNESTRGLYPGSKYPIYVNFPETGNTFEYELESLEVVG